MRRVASSCLVILLVACVIIGGLAYWQRQRVVAALDILQLTAAQEQYNEPLESTTDIAAFVDYLGDDVSLVAYSVQPDGTALEDETAIFHNADTPLPLASTIKIIVLAAYAQEVVTENLDPDTPVTLAEWETYYLPNTDGGAHPAALQELEIATAESGFAQDDSQTVTLDRIAYAMIRYSDNAATDYLLHLIGRDKINALIARQGLTGQEEPVPIGGLFTLWNNHERGDLTPERTAELLALPPDAIAEQAWAQSELLRTDAAWREAERAWRQGTTPTPPIRLQAQVVPTFPAGTARDYATLMGQVITGTFISPQVSAVMREYLEWPMESTENQAELRALGSKGGSLLGLLTEATFYIPRMGDFADQPRVVVLFMQDIPISNYFTLVSNFSHQLFMLHIAQEAPFAQDVRQRLTP